MDSPVDGTTEDPAIGVQAEVSTLADPFKGISLDDKFDLTKQKVFATGTQAVVRLLLMQKERDRRAGHNTAGFITGYRGSPLGVGRYADASRRSGCSTRTTSSSSRA